MEREEKIKQLWKDSFIWQEAQKELVEELKTKAEKLHLSDRELVPIEDLNSFFYVLERIESSDNQTKEKQK